MSPGIAPPKGGGDGGIPDKGGGSDGPLGGVGTPGVSNAAKGEWGDGPACASRLGISGGAPVLFLTKYSTLQSSGIFPPDFSTISLSFSKTFL